MPPFRNAVIVLFLIYGIASTAVAGGKSTYDFLRNDVGARAAALGGSFVAMTNDPNIIFYNPAGLGTIEGRKVSVGFFKHLLDINAGYASVATEIPGLGFIGAGVVYTNYGEFKRTGEEGQDLGTFGAGELAVTAGYGGTLSPGFMYGANVKIIYSSIGEYSSSGAAIDLGVQYEAVPGRMRLAASVLHLGTQFDPYGTTNESLPLDVNVGAAITPEHLPATIMIHLHKLNENYDSFSDRFKVFSVGTEFTLSPNLFLRLGYNHERRQELKVGQSSGLAGFSIGGGIMTEMYGIDYAFNSYGTIGALHRISIAFH